MKTLSIQFPDWPKETVIKTALEWAEIQKGVTLDPEAPWNEFAALIHRWIRHNLTNSRFMRTRWTAAAAGTIPSPGGGLFSGISDFVVVARL